MPDVSIIVPCYNEEATIQLLLESISRQTFHISDLEVILADGMSTDRTRLKVAVFQETNPDLKIKIVDNPKRIIPAALNAGLRAAQGDIIIRLDGHSMPYPDYVEQCVADLQSGLGDNVGGVWEIRPGNGTWMANSIAIAAAHPMGVGDARYRLASQAGLVDTVPFGSFKRALFERVGEFDETLLTNEDYEFNSRIRKLGGTIWLDPAIRSVYIARPGVGDLARQYWRYGFWKSRMLRRYPETLRWRQALPPLFVAGLIGLGILAIFWWYALILLAGVLIVYFLCLWLGSLQAAFNHKDIRLSLGVPLAIVTMHFSWGAGFLWSLVKQTA
jgi:succinoglycan biosynthesis protein ExoA